MRPIDADKFKEDLMKLWDYSCADGITATAVLKKVIQDLDNAPTITPSLNLDNITENDIEKFRMIWQRATSKGLPTFIEERPQGEWKETGYETGALGITYRQTQCSNCGWEHALPMWWNFCPNCGAKMQKGGAEE